MKPILFNTEMVRAILYGRKTCTWRVIKPQPEHVHTIFGPSEEKDRTFEFMCGYIRDGVCYDWIEAVTTPCQPGDVLYVRETWRVRDCIGDYAKGTKRVEIEYRAGSDSHIIYPTGPDFDKWRQRAKWHPSIHMPKEAARIFLRVTNVRAERLQDISPIGIRMEGIQSQRIDEWDCEATPESMNLFEFQQVWNSTIPKHPNKFKRYPYYWEDNPWVWVIEFERISREEVGRLYD